MMLAFDGPEASCMVTDEQLVRVLLPRKKACDLPFYLLFPLDQALLAFRVRDLQAR